MTNGRLTLAGKLLKQDDTSTAAVAAQYPFKLSMFLADRLREGSYSLEAARQFLPDVREIDHTSEGFDPCNEKVHKVGTTVIRRYDNRAALLVTHHCLVYCRFCFRRDFVGYPEKAIEARDLDAGIAYLAAHPENRDVLVTGGDPLALPNKKLLPILERLSAIDHLRVIRIHTRALSTHPSRMDEELLRFFRQSGKIWLYAHMNHPDDLNHSKVREAVREVRLAGVPVLNQAVILRGVNDEAEVLQRLLLSCYETQIIPYHLYVLDEVPGTAHFQVPADRLLELFDSVEHLPGPAQPVFVVVDGANLKHRMVPGRAIDRGALRQLLESKFSNSSS